MNTLVVGNVAGSKEDEFFFGSDTDLRYLGHDRVAYGFVHVSLNRLTGRSEQTEFIFPINPQQIEMDEEGATHIRPTQDGGKVIESQGNISKDIVISGTTGFLPKPPAQRASAQGVKPPTLFSSGDERQSIQERAAAGRSVSGYAYFMRLRTMFRRYWSIYKHGSPEERIANKLYWVNLKDNEIWLVEPLLFRCPRSTRSPLTHPYNIRLRTIAKGSAILTRPDPIKEEGPPQDRSLAATLADLALRLQNTANLVRNALTNLSENLRVTTLAALNVVDSVASGVSGIARGAAQVLDVPRSAVNDAARTVDNLFSAVEELVIDLPANAMLGLVSMRQALDQIRSRPELFEERWDAKWGEVVQAYSSESPTGASTGMSVPTALSENSPLPGETIYEFAVRTTGDANNAFAIITMNNLRAPYFVSSAEERREGTVAPGDVVLVPGGVPGTPVRPVKAKKPSHRDVVASSTPSTLTVPRRAWKPGRWKGYTVEITDGTGKGQTRLVEDNTETELTVSPAWETTPDMSSVFRLYFKETDEPAPPDAYLVDVNVEGRLTPTGDLAGIGGLPNLKQALGVKLQAEPGELVSHPWFGMAAGVGRRANYFSAFRLRLNAEQTLLSDPRVASVPSIKVTLDADRAEVNAVVIPVDSTEAVDLSVRVDEENR